MSQSYHFNQQNGYSDFDSLMVGTDFRVTFLLYLNLQCYKCTITIMSVWSSVVHIVMLNVVPCTKRVILGTQKWLSSLKEQEIRPACLQYWGLYLYQLGTYLIQGLHYVGQGVHGAQILVLVPKFTFKVILGVIFSHTLSLLLNIQIEKSENFDPQFLKLLLPLIPLYTQDVYHECGVLRISRLQTTDLFPLRGCGTSLHADKCWLIIIIMIRC